MDVVQRELLREYLVKGLVLNDDQLKAAETTFGKRLHRSIAEAGTALGAFRQHRAYGLQRVNST